MSGITLDYSIDLSRHQDLLARIGSADTQPLMDEIGAQLLAAIHWRFENEETPEGEAWQRSYRADAEGGKTLQDRGHLRDSYTYIASTDETEIGSNLIYAAIHHEGGEIRAKNGGYLKFKVGDRWVQKASVEIPARPALGLNDDDHEEIDEITQNFYEGLINGH